MVDGEKLILDSIYYKKNELYGLLERPRERVKSNHWWQEPKNIKIEVKIEEDRIVQIWLHNRKKSRSVNMPIIIIGSIGLVACLAFLYIVASVSQGL